MQKQLQLFMVDTDELELSRLLTHDIPGIRFLNDNVWPSTPDSRQSIGECSSGRVYLYRESLEDLPTMRRKNGDLEGPIAGCVVQILRSLERDGILLSGRIAISIDAGDKQMLDFANRIWKCLTRIGKVGVVRPDGRIDQNYLVGTNTKKRVAEGAVRIADRAVGMLYEPVA